MFVTRSSEHTGYLSWAINITCMLNTASLNVPPQLNVSISDCVSCHLGSHFSVIFQSCMEREEALKTFNIEFQM